jgi:transposase
MARRKFGREFKIEAVRRVTQRSLAVAKAVRGLDIAESLLWPQLCKLRQAPVVAFPGTGPILPRLPP